MTDFVKFPSIDQYRNAVKWVRQSAEFHSNRAPVIPYRGTVKLHGTNAAIVRRDGVIHFQSRNRILTPGDDNLGFAAAMSALPDGVLDCLLYYCGIDSADIALFGEWCGQGIQRGVGISQLPKMFVIFAARVGEAWVDVANIPSARNHGIFKITDFPVMTLDIDFEKPEQASEELRKITEAVEQLCPVAAHFGVDGIGEGVVWQPADDRRGDSRYWFKVKGEKHSASKVRTLAAVDVEAIKRRDDLLDAVVTDNRLAQGLDYLREMKIAIEMRNIGDYLRWVFNDVVKEEADTIAAAGLTPKELGSPISVRAKRYFIASVNEGIE